VDNFDIAVAYRIYPKVAQPALGLPFSEDKLRLSEVCLRSFKESLGALRVRIWALLDGCPPSYREMFQRYFNDDDLVLVALDHVGNQATFGKQIDTLLEQDNSDLVYFAEDDYFYLPNQFYRLLDLLREYPDVGFVTPYDHPDCYRLEIHRHPKHLRVCGEHHWRTAASTCLTFATRKETLRRNERIFRSYCHRNYDCSMWLSLTKKSVFNPARFSHFALGDRRFAKIIGKSWLFGWKQILFGKQTKLWAPVPGIATHLDVNAMSPGINWIALMHEAVIEGERPQTQSETSVCNSRIR
jgi:Glycosyl transferase family 2